MPRTTIDGTGIEYEVIGTGPRTAVVTPGGRYSKDIEGVRGLAEAIAAGGFRVLIWDRPNTGASDICFAGESESRLNADMLAALLTALNMSPAMIIAGSGASREALLTAIRHPEVVERLFLFWISGGPIGLSVLPVYYCADSAQAAMARGMEAVAALSPWSEAIARDPANRDIVLGQDREAFVERMIAWCQSYFPEDGSPVPGMTRAEIAAIDRPVMILRSSRLDLHHLRSTGEAVHALIPGAQIAEPPWGEREWLDRFESFPVGGSAALHWPMLAPQILAFAGP